MSDIDDSSSRRKKRTPPMDKKTSDIVAVVAVVAGFGGYLASVGTSPTPLIAWLGMSNLSLIHI